jgi:outer membrane lipoprotein-sorting protein
MPSLPSRRAALTALAATALAAPALAAGDQNGLVARAIAYLDSLNDVKARFTQSDARGDVAEGAVYLARPGRARFEYDPPSGLLITSDGRTVTLTDTRLKTVQRIPLSATPLAVFLADHVRLDRGAKITRVDPGADGFSITARDTRNLAGGEITLYFADRPMRLSGWAITDPQARVTRVSLGALTPFTPPSEAFFTQGPAG